MHPKEDTNISRFLPEIYGKIVLSKLNSAILEFISQMGLRTLQGIHWGQNSSSKGACGHAIKIRCSLLLQWFTCAKPWMPTISSCVYRAKPNNPSFYRQIVCFNQWNGSKQGHIYSGTQEPPEYFRDFTKFGAPRNSFKVSDFDHESLDPVNSDHTRGNEQINVLWASGMAWQCPKISLHMLGINHCFPLDLDLHPLLHLTIAPSKIHSSLISELKRRVSF